MKKLMLMAAFALALPAAAQAQESPRGPGRGQMHTIEFLVKAAPEYNATAEQVAKLNEILAKFTKDTDKLRAEALKVREEMKGGADRSALMLKMRPIRDELQKFDDAAVEEALKVLNAEQQKHVQHMVDARKQDMSSRRGQRPGAKPIQ